jgi:phospholipid/cholesterol/gamma-HCH transport system ATP-binding protein
LPFIEVKNLSFSYGDDLILDSINENFEKGLCHIVTSRAGEGKTTLLKLIAGLKLPTSGQILVDGKSISLFSKKQMLDFHRKTGFLFQDAALINNMNILDNLALYYRYNTNLKEVQILETILNYLDYFDLRYALYLRPEQLSHGLQMIISFIRAILDEPELIILDEPVETLDQVLVQKMIEEIKKLKNKGCTTIISTHRVHLFEKICDKVMIIKEKKVIFSGTIRNLKLEKNEEIKEMLET